MAAEEAPEAVTTAAAVMTVVVETPVAAEEAPEAGDDGGDTGGGGGGGGVTPLAVSLSASPNPVDEGSAVTMTATLTAVLPADVTVPLSLSHGTAEDGDYGTLASITIDAGSTTGTGTVSTTDDADRDDETFTVALGTLPATVTEGSPSSVEVTIRGHDHGAKPAVRAHRPAVSGNERAARSSPPR